MSAVLAEPVMGHSELDSLNAKVRCVNQFYLNKIFNEGEQLIL